MLNVPRYPLLPHRLARCVSLTVSSDADVAEILSEVFSIEIVVEASGPFAMSNASVRPLSIPMTKKIGVSGTTCDYTMNDQLPTKLFKDSANS